MGLRQVEQGISSFFYQFFGIFDDFIFFCKTLALQAFHDTILFVGIIRGVCRFSTDFCHMVNVIMFCYVLVFVSAGVAGKFRNAFGTLAKK